MSSSTDTGIQGNGHLNWPDGGEQPSETNDIRTLRAIRLAELAARRAGPLDSPLEAMSPEELEAPIEIEDVAASEENDDTACAPSHPLPEVRIDGYDVMERISAGGQATVYGAVHVATGRKVAIKVVAGGPEIAARTRARYEREAEILAGLNHPNIVSILDRGRTHDGSFYMSMPYIDGANLDDYLKAASLSLEATLDLFVRITAAVAEAHRRNVVHRDLKPSNVRIDSRGEPHILDFGLARIHRDEPLDRSDSALTLTRPGQIVGSLYWLSPEQAGGSATKIGPCSDVYTLGVMIYEAVTGEFPYPTNVPVRDLLNSIVEAMPSPLSRHLSGHNAVVRSALNAVIFRALKKSPSERQASAAELAADLSACLTLVRSTGTRRPTEGLRRLSQRPVLIVLFTGLIAAGTAIVLLRSQGEPADAGVTEAALVTPYPSGRSVPTEAPAQPLQRISNSIGMTFVMIPPGTFQMGIPDGEPRRPDEFEDAHPVMLTKPFGMSVTETTRGQYVRVMRERIWNPEVGDAELPADEVPFEKALKFCEELGRLDGRLYTLPTEAQWEYACRAGTDAPFSGDGVLEHMGWFDQNSGARLHPVGSKQPNQWGLYDMHGNAREWCSDYFAAYAKELQVDPKGGVPSFHRVVRGGGADLPWRYCRSAARMAFDPDNRTRMVGFRVVLESP